MRRAWMIAQRTDFAKPRQSTLKAQPLRVFGAAAPQLESQKLPCRLQANLGRTPRLHEASGHAVAGLSSRALEISQEDGRTGGSARFLLFEPSIVARRLR